MRYSQRYALITPYKSFLLWIIKGKIQARCTFCTKGGGYKKTVFHFPRFACFKMARQKRQFIQASILIKSSVLDISQRQFPRTSWFLAHGQFSSCSFGLFHSNPINSKNQFLWRHHFLAMSSSVDSTLNLQLQLTMYCHQRWPRKLKILIKS